MAQRPVSERRSAALFDELSNGASRLPPPPIQLCHRQLPRVKQDEVANHIVLRIGPRLEVLEHLPSLLGNLDGRRHAIATIVGRYLAWMAEETSGNRKSQSNSGTPALGRSRG
jgi:hypothetical protein